MIGLDLFVLLFYLAGMVAFGCWFVRRSRNTEGFMAAGRSLPGWAVGLSIFGTYVSSISFLANPGKSFDANWNPFAFSLSLPLAAWIAARFFVPYYRASNAISAYQHLETRFGLWARTYAGVCYLLTQFARMGTIMYLVALAMAPLTGWDIRTIILVTGVLVTVYTLMGGIEAVIWTDVVQSLVLTGGMLVCIALLLFGMPERPAAIKPSVLRLRRTNQHPKATIPARYKSKMNRSRPIKLKDATRVISRRARCAVRFRSRLTRQPHYPVK